jgi:hypothetical protein
MAIEQGVGDSRKCSHAMACRAGKLPFDRPRVKLLSAAGERYAASVPIQKVLAEDGDVLLAYEMNGVGIPEDHGFPLRAVIPGHVAARSVKWLEKVIISDEESDSHWQQRDYKGFCPGVPPSRLCNCWYPSAYPSCTQHSHVPTVMTALHEDPPPPLLFQASDSRIKAVCLQTRIGTTWTGPRHHPSKRCPSPARFSLPPLPPQSKPLQTGSRCKGTQSREGAGRLCVSTFLPMAAKLGRPHSCCRRAASRGTDGTGHGAIGR